MNKKWYNIMLNEDKSSIEVNIYGILGWEVTANQFLAELKSYKNIKTINLHVNSVGGDMFDGIAIYNTLKQHEAKVIAYVDAVALSIASVIVMAADEIIMYKTSHLMIHKPWTISIGNANELQKDIEVLNRLEKSIIDVYLEKFEDKKEKDIANMLEAETWIDANEALEFGLINKIADGGKEDKVNDLYKNEVFKEFKNIPERIKNILNQKVFNIKIPKFQFDDNVPVKQGGDTVINLQLPNNEPNNKGDVQMTEEEKKAIQQAERDRINNIRAAGKTLKVSNEVVDKAINDNVGLEEANKIFIDFFAKHTIPLSPENNDPDVQVQKDETDKFRNGCKKAFHMMAGYDMSKEDKEEVRKNNMPKNLHGLARVCLERAGIKNTGSMTPLDLWSCLIGHIRNEGTSQGSGDFTNILADSINKGFGVGMEQAAVTYPAWTKRMPVNDFRTFNLVNMSHFSDIELIPEGKDFPHGAISDKKETGSVTTKGKQYVLSRQAFINDDMGFIGRVPTAVGNSVSRIINKDCYDSLISNSYAGPTMTEDSNSLFDATNHSNYVESGSGGAPSHTTLAAGREAMRLQALLAPDDRSASIIGNIVPRSLIVPANLEATVEPLVMTPFRPDATYPQGVYNPFGPGGKNQLIPVVEPYLDSGNSTGWYLAADPNTVDTYILLTLSGFDAPTIRSAASDVGEALGIKWDIFFDYGWMVGDWRGLYYNYGE